LLPPFRSAVAVVRETGYRGEEALRADFQRKAVARVFNDCAGKGDRDIEELLLQLFDHKTDIHLKDVVPAPPTTADLSGNPTIRRTSP
jgi:hypothetical protein